MWKPLNLPLQTKIASQKQYHIPEDVQRIFVPGVLGRWKAAIPTNLRSTHLFGLWKRQLILENENGLLYI